MFYQNFYAREGKLIFRACHVSVPKINTDADLPVLLLYRHHVRKPFRMLLRPDEFRGQKLFYFSFNLSMKFGTESTNDRRLLQACN